MEPTFADGALVLIEPVGVRRFREKRGGAISAGDVVIARHPFKKLDVIKFVDQVHDDDHLWLRSPSGDDSHQFGRVPVASVKGRVTARFSPYSVPPWENAT